ACEVGGEPRADIRKRAARVDKIHGHHFATEVREAHRPAKLIGQREIRHERADGNLVGVGWEQNAVALILDDGAASEPAYSVDVGAGPSRDQLKLDLSARVEAVDLGGLTDPKRHRHGGHVARDLAMRDQKSLFRLVNIKDYAARRKLPRGAGVADNQA